MIRTCERCGAEFKTKPSAVVVGNGRFCSRSCARLFEWSKREEGTHYKNLNIPDHPLAGATGLVPEHRVVLYTKIGPGSHPCHWCGKTLTWKTYQSDSHIGLDSLLSDHLDGNKRHNDPDNLVPSCHSCNAWRSRPQRHGIDEDELFITLTTGARAGARKRAVKLNCVYCGAEFLREAAQARRGNPEKCCSLSCARRLEFERLGHARSRPRQRS